MYTIMQHVLDMRTFALNGQWETALFSSIICFESRKMSDRSVWAFKINKEFTDRLLLGSFYNKQLKCSNKELMHLMIHSSLFVRG